MLAAESTIRKIGNSKGIIIDKSICADLGLDLGTRVSMVADGGILTLKPARAEGKPRIGAAKGKVIAPESWFSDDVEAEITGLFEATRP